SVYKADNNDVVRATPIKTYFCPTRRGPTVRPDTNANNNRPLALNDYAMPMWKDNAGPTGQGAGTAGCWNWWSDGTGDDENYPFYRATVFVRGGKRNTTYPPGRMVEVTDGTSNTIMLAEKYIDISRYKPPQVDLDPAKAGASPNSGFTDSGYWGGYTWGTLRCSGNCPVRGQ